MFLSGPFIIFTTMKSKKKPYKPGKKSNLVDVFYLIRKSLLNDLKIKIFALFFAIIIWIYTILGNQYTHPFQVPLDIINIVEGKTLKEPVPDKITAEFTGKGSELVFLYLAPISGFKFQLDLQNIKYFYDFDLMEYYQRYPENVVLPRNMNITFNKILQPDSIEVELDFESTRKIPIVPLVNIDTESGYIKIGDLVIIPDSLTVTGPNFYVKQLNQIYTDSLNRFEVSLPVNVDLPLNLPKLGTLDFSHNKVNIYQRVEQIGEKIIKDIPVQVKNRADNIDIQLSPEVISVKISAGLSSLSNITADDFEVIFDYKKSWQAGENYYQPEIVKPDAVIDIIEIIPEHLDVRVLRERVSK